jgi:hypothetical protein
MDQVVAQALSVYARLVKAKQHGMANAQAARSLAAATRGAASKHQADVAD